MFYLSRGEQVALLILVALLLGGASVLTYQRGVRAGREQVAAPLLREPRAAPAPAAARVQEPGARAAATADGDAPPAHEESHARSARGAGRRGKRAARAPGSARVSLNHATREQLEALPGISAVFAQRIIAHREELRRANGRGFTDVDELLDVPGMEAPRFLELRAWVVP